MSQLRKFDIFLFSFTILFKDISLKYILPETGFIIIRGKNMPNCKNCGARITKFDADMCPICGEIKPLEGVTSETVEITTELNVADPAFKQYKPTKRKVALLLSIFVGIFGSAFLYIKKMKLAIIWLAINLIIIGGLGSILAWATPLGPLWGYLIPVLVMYAINIGIGVYFMVKPDLKDGNGEFIR